MQLTVEVDTAHNTLPVWSESWVFGARDVMCIVADITVGPLVKDTMQWQMTVS